MEAAAAGAMAEAAAERANVYICMYTDIDVPGKVNPVRLTLPPPLPSSPDRIAGRTVSG